MVLYFEHTNGHVPSTVHAKARATWFLANELMYQMPISAHDGFFIKQWKQHN